MLLISSVFTGVEFRVHPTYYCIIVFHTQRSLQSCSNKCLRYVHVYITHARAHRCTHARMYGRADAHTDGQTHACTYEHKHTRHTPVCTHARMHTPTHTHTHMHTHTYIHTHTQIHTVAYERHLSYVNIVCVHRLVHRLVHRMCTSYEYIVCVHCMCTSYVYII